MIYTRSKFNYGHTITLDNAYLPFKEGSSDAVEAELALGNYSLGEMAQVVQDALNSAGALTYTVTLNRAAGLFTISASGPFSLLISTAQAAPFELLGFTLGVDLTGQSSYTGNAYSGSAYYPQFLLQSYVSPENLVESVEASVNESADGRVELIRFGVRQKIEMELKFITDLPMDNDLILSNPNGVLAARNFLKYITQKKKFEFVPDIAQPSQFYKVILEKTADDSKGTGFRLKELYADGLNDIYESGLLTLRVMQ